VYRALALVTLGIVTGVPVFVWQRGWPGTLSAAQRDVLSVFAAVIAFVAAEYVIYNLTFVQFQGRYLYPALIPLALIVAVGLAGWTSLAESLFPAMNWLPVMGMIALALFAWYALDTYLVPNLPHF